MVFPTPGANIHARQNRALASLQVQNIRENVDYRNLGRLLSITYEIMLGKFINFNFETYSTSELFCDKDG